MRGNKRGSREGGKESVRVRAVVLVLADNESRPRILGPDKTLGDGDLPRGPFFYSSIQYLTPKSRSRSLCLSNSKKSKIGNNLAKAAALRISLNIDGTPLTSRSHTHPSHSQTFRL
jgi:hypothetical protein